MTGRMRPRYCGRCGTRLARDNHLGRCAPCQRQAGELLATAPDVPSEFWGTTVMGEALASWHIGQVIRAYRHHPHHESRPLSQELVAGWLGLTQTQLSRIENGPPVKDLDKLTTWARTLKIPAGLLWFRLPGVDDLPETHTTGPADVRASGTTPFSVPGLARSAGPASDADAAVMHAFRAADLQVGGGHLYATVVGYLQTAIAPRLFGAVPAGPEVFAAASAITEMAGWMAHDAGRDPAAQQHFARSLDLASAASDRQLKAHILASMSHLAIHESKPEQAIRFAQQGQDALGSAIPNPELAARLLTMEARGLAALPQPEPAMCGKALLRAEQMLDHLPAEQPSVWISRFDEGSLASEVARCLRQLGQFGAAARQAERIVELRPGTRARSRAFGQLLLASVLISQGEPEQACALALEVLDTTHSLSSYLVIQQLRDLGRLLEPYQANHTVAGFLTLLRGALRQRSWFYSWLSTDGHTTVTPETIQ